MSYGRLKEHLRDVAFTTAVPFDEDGDAILHDELRRNTRAVMDAGGRTVIPCGNTGEYYSLADEERVAVVETTIEAVGDDGVVVAGVGGSTDDAVERIREYERAGADAVMIHGPDHTYIHRHGLVDYYRKLAESTDIGVVLYKRGPEISIPVVQELSTIENVVGVKFAVNDVNEFSKMVREVSGDVVFSTGIAERFAPAFALEGAEGFTTGIGSFVPDLVLALQDALERGDYERALELRDLARPFEDLREETGPNNDLSAANNVPVVKYGLELAGRYGGPVREPIVELSADSKRRAEEYYERIEDADVAPRTDA